MPFFVRGGGKRPPPTGIGLKSVSYFRVVKSEESAIAVFKMIKIYLIYAVLNQILLPICPKFLKEGGGPIGNQKVLFFVPNFYF